jgi:pyrimidine deaminase RibD-like protein
MDDSERRFMELAMEEARKCKPEDERAHPLVGAVAVKNGRVLAVGHRGEPKQGNHAEFALLESKLRDEILTGATIYTTLEPCTTRNHPKVPCSGRLIERKVSRVVIGMLDPNPDITGRGVLRLRGANTIIDFFPSDLMAQIEEINREFIRIQGTRPRSPSIEVNSQTVLTGIHLEVLLNRIQAESILFDLGNLEEGNGLIPLRRLHEKATAGFLQHPLPCLGNDLNLLVLYLDDVRMFNRLLDSIDIPTAGIEFRMTRINQALGFKERLAESGERLLVCVVANMRPAGIKEPPVSGLNKDG